MTYQPTFTTKFKFRPDLAFHIGVEREFFVANKQGLIVPEAHRVLERITNPLPDAGSFSYELSACQIESQSLPTDSLDAVWSQQVKLEDELDSALAACDLQRLCQEVAPDDMSLAVYSDPAGRYQRIATEMPREVLQAACQVAGTHFHIGMPSAEIALQVYNRVIAHCDELCHIGDNSNGKRMRLYGIVAPGYRPVAHESWNAFEVYAKQHGFYENPRDCWHMIRLTLHGTIEFRNFGVTESVDDIIKWAYRCRELCLHYS